MVFIISSSKYLVVGLVAVRDGGVNSGSNYIILELVAYVLFQLFVF